MTNKSVTKHYCRKTLIARFFSLQKISIYFLYSHNKRFNVYLNMSMNYPSILILGHIILNITFVSYRTPTSINKAWCSYLPKAKKSFSWYSSVLKICIQLTTQETNFCIGPILYPTFKIQKFAHYVDAECWKVWILKKS